MESNDDFKTVGPRVRIVSKGDELKRTQAYLMKTSEIHEQFTMWATAAGGNSDGMPW